MTAPGWEVESEIAALERLAALVARVDDRSSAKLAALVETLRAIGVGAGSPLRAVVFSERHATLQWLAETLRARLGLGRRAVRVLHGGLPDLEQQEVVEEFALADSQVRLLLTGDIASEGVNLHRQCHHLIHFDLPWSLITIEQRNGRIDRYGQRHSPEIRALLLTGAHPDVKGDLGVLARLLGKEDEAHRALGDAGSLMGLHSAAQEESEITNALAEQRPLDEVVPSQPRSGFDLMMVLAGQTGAEPVGTIAPLSLFRSDEAFLDEALREAFEDPEAELDIRREPQHRLLSFVPPADLARWLEVLPQGYLAERRVLERLKLTADRHGDRRGRALAGLPAAGRLLEPPRAADRRRVDGGRPAPRSSARPAAASRPRGGRRGPAARQHRPGAGPRHAAAAGRPRRTRRSRAHACRARRPGRGADRAGPAA